MAASFIERYAKPNTRESSWRESERILNREIIPTWQGRRLGEITRADVHHLLDGIADRGSPIMANRTLAAIRKMFAWAVERGIIETSPCDRIKAPSVERSRDRVLSDEELHMIWKSCVSIGWPFGPLFQLLIITAQRRDEVGSLTWKELDLSAKIWTLPRARTKNNTEHAIPLSNIAMQVIEAIPRVRGSAGFVFSTNGRTAVSGFTRAKERIDELIHALRVRACVETGGKAEDIKPLPRWTPHDLRRTAASGMARLGIALPVIEKVLNHSSGSFAGIVGVYQRHSFAEEKRQALDAWGTFVERLVSDETDANVVALRAKMR